MKKIFATVALVGAIFLAKPAVAQTVFAPAGAEWWYEVLTIGGPYAVHVYAFGDTTLPGHTGSWRCLRSQEFGYNTGGYYPYPGTSAFAFTQVRGDQVWVVRDSVESLFLDFGLPTAFSDTVAFCPGGSWSGVGVLTLDSVSTRPWASAPQRVQWWSSTTSGGVGLQPLWRYTGAVAERIGYLNALMFPSDQCGSCPDYPSLRYYADNGGSFGQRPTIVSGIAESALTRALQLAPNPSTGRFSINDLAEKLIDYEIVDAKGCQVRRGRLSAANAAVDLSDQPAGMYLLRGTVAGQAFTRRLVRE
jgi:hypothetical protein